MQQLLFPDGGCLEPDLTQYDCIVVSSSGGKDSQAMLSMVVDRAKRAGVFDRVSVVHADLGEMEWPGTHELVHDQAAHFGVPVTVVSRIGGVAKRDSSTYRKGEVFGDILDYAQRRKAFPDASRRWCTSEFKRAPIEKHFTALAREQRERHPEREGPVRILDCMGFRSQESRARARRVPFTSRKRTRRQHVDTWLPIHDWTVERVWEEIRASGTPYHEAYDLGMTRLSCVFCIMASKSDLKIAAQANPGLLARYIEVEESTGHDFRQGASLVELLSELPGLEHAF